MLGCLKLYFFFGTAFFLNCSRTQWMFERRMSEDHADDNARRGPPRKIREVLDPGLDSFLSDADAFEAHSSRKCRISLLIESAEQIHENEEADVMGGDTYSETQHNHDVQTPPRDVRTAVQIGDSPSGFIWTPQTPVQPSQSTAQVTLLDLFSPNANIVESPGLSLLYTDPPTTQVVVREIFKHAQDGERALLKRKNPPPPFPPRSASRQIAPSPPPRLVSLLHAPPPPPRLVSRQLAPPFPPSVVSQQLAPPPPPGAVPAPPPYPPTAVRVKSEALSDTQVRMLFEALKPGGECYHGGDLKQGKMQILNGLFGFHTSRENINNILGLGSRVLHTYTLWDLKDAQTYLSLGVSCKGCLRVNKKRLFGWLCNHKRGSQVNQARGDEYIKIFPGGRPSPYQSIKTFAAASVEYSSDPYEY